MNPAEAIEVLMKSGLSQVQIAKEIDCSPSSISKILSGTSPNYDTGLALVAWGRRVEAQRKRKEKAHGTHAD